MNLPEFLHQPVDEFADSFAQKAKAGEQHCAEASVCFVGLARNCATHLKDNLERLRCIGQRFLGWQLHIETNDNDDDTDQVLVDFAKAHRQATFTSRRLGRQHFTAEFAGPRTAALAEYRSDCQRWVRDNARHADLVVVIDFDAWGGWSDAGFFHGVGTLYSNADAYGVASVSLMEHLAVVVANDGKPEFTRAWQHYDAWSLRLNSYLDDYTAGVGGWKHQWLPPVGSPPIPVCSAFGGLAIYDKWAFLKGTYSGEDCEHVPFHRTIAERTGQRLFLDPAMRTLMHWMSDGWSHRDN
jgi:hypothetical protein